MDNSNWIDASVEGPPDGKTVLAYIKGDRFGSSLVLIKSQKISNGYMAIIDGLFYFDFSNEILCWRHVDELENDIPLKFLEVNDVASD